MTHSKPWYTSKTIWASVAAIVGAALSLFGMPFGVGAEALLAERLTELATVLAGLIALYGRLTADKRIEISHLNPVDPTDHSGSV